MNKYQEAYNTVAEIMDYYQGRQENIYAMQLLKELVDKETPYQPKSIVWVGYEGSKQGECKCGKFPLNPCDEDYGYCLFCGQALDWSEE